MNKIVSFGVILVIIIMMMGCSSAQPTDEPVGVANPASVYCADNGGTLEIRDGENGQVGICVFSDGSECEEWSYFRGECKPGQ